MSAKTEEVYAEIKCKRCCKNIKIICIGSIDELNIKELKSTLF